MVGIDQIVGGVGEEGVTLVRSGPLRRRIGARDELRRDLTGRPESGVIQRCEILADRSTSPGAKIVGAPRVTRNGALFVGIGSDEARVHRKPVAAHQAFAQAAFHHGLEEVPQDVALPEPAMAVARKGGMVRNLGVQSQTAEPSIGEVEMNLLAEPPLGPNAHAISNDQHPHHQLGSDRGATDGAVEWLQLRAHARQIEELVDPSKLVVVRDVIIETEIVKQPRRCHLRSHHRPVPSESTG